MTRFKELREEDIKTVLEIGSSSGEGSTEDICNRSSAKPDQTTLFCVGFKNLGLVNYKKCSRSFC